jgi:NAD(P)-dependent dehydrogenase (short-subunit alcohol dehydrogenase family)
MEAQRAWFITGASRGFDVEITREALQHGDHVVGMARNLQAVVEAIGEHPNLLAVKLEVTSEAGAHQARISSSNPSWRRG